MANGPVYDGGGAELPRVRLPPGGGRGRRSGLRCESSTVPFEQMGQSDTKRLWRQKSDTCPGGSIRAVGGAIVSGLQLGTTVRAADIARGGQPLERLVEAVSDAD